MGTFSENLIFVLGTMLVGGLVFFAQASNNKNTQVTKPVPIPAPMIENKTITQNEVTSTAETPQLVEKSVTSAPVVNVKPLAPTKAPSVQVPPHSIRGDDEGRGDDEVGD